MRRHFIKALAILCMIGGILVGTKSQAATYPVKISGKCYYDKAYQVLSIVNKERKAKGLKSLSMDKTHMDVAMQRSLEIGICFSHSRPDGNQGLKYLMSKLKSGFTMAGENIAAGYNSCETAKEVMKGWMNSPGHRANILTKKYTTIGIGCVKHNGAYYWTQVFSNKKASKTKKPANKTKSSTIKVKSSYKYKSKITNNKPTVLRIGAKYTPRLNMQIMTSGKKSFWPFVPANSSFRWVSSNSKVASVSSSGVVKGKKTGTCKITAYRKNVGSQICRFTIKVVKK